MTTEFRLYDKVNCSIFDLIGALEPDQTKSLGLLFANSVGALNVFLRIIGMSAKQCDKYVVDCEPRNIKKKRFDILIRFYKNNHPIEALLVEAKSVNVSNASKRAAVQLKNHSSFNQLNGFSKQICVSLTRDTALSTAAGVETVTWSQFISSLHDFAIKTKDKIAYDYINYIMSIQGNMNYYEEDILSIPAGKTLTAILKSGIYECPIVGRRYVHQRRTLYLTFKNAKGGAMDTLYKLHDIIEGVDLNDLSQIAVLENMQGYTGIGTRIADYKSCAHYSQNDHSSKRLFVLDLDNSITLPNPVRPLENNSNWPYYKLKDFLQPVNSNQGQVVLQNNITIIGNELRILANGRKKYELYESGIFIASFTHNGTFTLNSSKSYHIDVIGVNRGGHRCQISLNHVNNSWNLFYNL